MRTQCLLFVVREEQTAESVKSSISAKIKGYVIFPSVIEQQKRSAILNLFALNNVEILSEQECPFLQSALDRGQVEILELIIAEISGKRRFRVSVEAGNSSLVSCLLRINAVVSKIDFKPSNSFNVLDKDSIKIIEQILVNKADHVYRNPRGGSLLHLAVIRSNLRLIQSLLRIKAKVDVKRNDGSTPLHLAVLKENVEIINLLLKNGACINAIKEDGSTSLLIAAQRNNLRVIKLLLKNNASVQIGNNDGLMPIHAAAKTGSNEIVEELLSYGANVNDNMLNKLQSPLVSAARRRKVKMVKMLLKHGVNVNSRNELGETALHVAAWNGSLKIVKILVGHNADIEAKCFSQKTPIFKAAEKGRSQIVILLLNLGASIETNDKFDRSALHYAAEGSGESFIELLLYNFPNKDFGKSSICKYIEESFRDYSDPEFYTYENINLKHNCLLFYRHLIRASEAYLFNDAEQFYPGWFTNVENELQCRQESKMEMVNVKAQNVGDSNITLYDILTASEGQLAQFMRQYTVREAFCSREYRANFKQYRGYFECQYEKGMRRKKLLEESIKGAYTSLKMFSVFPYKVMEKIFDHLSSKDVEWLVDPWTRLAIAEMDCFQLA